MHIAFWFDTYSIIKFSFYSTFVEGFSGFGIDLYQIIFPQQIQDSCLVIPRMQLFFHRLFDCYSDITVLKGTRNIMNVLFDSCLILEGLFFIIHTSVPPPNRNGKCHNIFLIQLIRKKESCSDKKKKILIQLSQKVILE